jgi:hypothetical protein
MPFCRLTDRMIPSDLPLFFARDGQDLKEVDDKAISEFSCGMRAVLESPDDVRREPSPPESGPDSVVIEKAVVRDRRLMACTLFAATCRALKVEEDVIDRMWEKGSDPDRGANVSVLARDDTIDDDVLILVQEETIMQVRWRESLAFAALCERCGGERVLEVVRGILAVRNDMMIFGSSRPATIS